MFEEIRFLRVYQKQNTLFFSFEVKRADDYWTNFGMKTAKTKSQFSYLSSSVCGAVNKIIRMLRNNINLNTKQTESVGADLIELNSWWCLHACELSGDGECATSRSFFDQSSRRFKGKVCWSSGQLKFTSRVSSKQCSVSRKTLLVILWSWWVSSVSSIDNSSWNQFREKSCFDSPKMMVSKTIYFVLLVVALSLVVGK